MRRALSYLIVFALGIGVALLAVHLLSPGEEAGPTPPRPDATTEAAGAEAGPDGGKTVRLDVLRPSDAVTRLFRDGGWPVGAAPSAPDAGAPAEAAALAAAPAPEAQPASSAKPAAPDGGERGYAISWVPPTGADGYSDTLTIRGHVSWRGPAPKKSIAVDRDRDVCGVAVQDDSVVVAQGKLAGTFVHLGALSIRPVEAATREATLESRGCRFLPRAQLAPGATKVVLTNNDARIRDVEVYFMGKLRETRLLPSQGGTVELPLMRGLNELRDKAYPWMRAFIDTSSDGHTALTGADGAFEFKDVDLRYTSELVIHHYAPDYEQTIPMEGRRRSGTYEVEVFLP